MNNPFYVLLAILAAAAMAAPAIIEQADAVAGRSTPTTCVTGSPVTTSGFDIDYQPLEAVASGNRFYDIEPSFKTDHSVGSAMVRIINCPLPPPRPHIVPLNPYTLCADGLAKRSRTWEPLTAIPATRTPHSSASSRATRHPDASRSSGGSWE